MAFLRGSGVLLFSIACVSCSVDQAPPGWDVTVIEDDVEVSEDAQPDVLPEVLDASPVFDMAPPHFPREYNAELWEQSGAGCVFGEEAVVSDEPFVKPEPFDGPFTDHGPLTRSQITGWAAGGSNTLPSNMVVTVLTNDELNGGSKDGSHAYVGENETFTFRIHIGRGNFDFDEVYTNLATVLVDGEPIVANYSLWRDEREDVLVRTTGTGFLAGHQDDFSYVDYEIPADVFSDNRTHIVTILLETHKPGSVMHGNIAKTVEVHHQGYSRLAVECFEEPLQGSMTRIEMDFDARTDRDRAVLFSELETDPDRALFGPPTKVAPGQVVKFFTTLHTKGSDEQRSTVPMLMVPALDAQPLDQEAWRVSTVMISNEENRTAIPKADARKTFEVKMPEEPGIHYVTVYTVGNPHFADFTRDPIDNAGEDDPRRTSVNIDPSSNTLRFEVVAPD